VRVLVLEVGFIVSKECIKSIFKVKYWGAQTWGIRSLEWSNFYGGVQHFGVFSMDLASCHHSGTNNLEVSPRILCTSG